MKSLSILYLFFSFALSYYLLLFTIPILRRRGLDKPNSRSSHSSPKPTGGGVVFVLIAISNYFFLGNSLGLILLPLSIIGLIDDLFKVNNSVRYCFQFITSIALVYWSNIINMFEINNFSVLFIFLYLILSISSTAIINFINFMDGIDGLVASCMSLVFIVAGIKIDHSIFFLVSPIVGFLFLNWDPSKVFMGDIGSTFIGASFSALLLRSDNFDECMKILIVACPLLLDAFVCVIRRYFANENIFKAHSLHLYQRLYQSGWSHGKITIYYLIATLFLAVNVLLANWFFIIVSFCLVCLFGFWLDQRVSLPFKLSLLNSKNSFLM